ncbi:FCS-Like Zinc finger 8-like [Phragmites australis]|uniref:FCS-Like Zinc finger 8-like n=1 Tax=Phragmites australis TaxID=29695 RepID=UPI002D774A3B|nr:FCS-Like Zinc finger 8-like [Phragmites australis]XP_062219821.1 FCS-Like Zinc finger 8-like [Phragmites australis]XP_062219831.1 FCS-Like Zinc finger 8-like [Phragmites australis]
MVESNGQKSTAPAGFFRVPGLFVRLSSKGLNNAVDPDSVWSPTSPLDFKNLRSSPPRVGLGLVDALTAHESSLQFGCKSSFLDSIRPFVELAFPKAAACEKAGSTVGFATLDEVNEFADSEEYTCVIARGANPRTTHILGGGETLEVHKGAVGGCRKPIFSIEPFSDHPSPSPSPLASVASGRCGCCMKRLQEDRDIYMYLGENAFCSNECRKGYIEEIGEVEELMVLDSAMRL